MKRIIKEARMPLNNGSQNVITSQRESYELRITEERNADDGKGNETPDRYANLVLAHEALCGLPGEIVRTIEPYSEADPVAILVNVLVMFGNVIGRGPFFRVEETPHYSNFYAVITGVTAKGRKGTSMSTPKKLFTAVDPTWVNDKITSGLSSGEGLIYAVRDYGFDASSGRNTPAITDKRILVVEEEFAQPLKTMKREGNILSPVLRDGWDGKNLHPLTKTDPIVASNPHISIIGHITEEELLRYLTQTEMGNGFANRFIWLYAKRSKLIPNPTGVPQEKLDHLSESLRIAVNEARTIVEMRRDEAAEIMWADIYQHLSEGERGLAGAVTSRAEAQVLRLSMLYALMNRSAVIKLDHLHAALALWEYSKKSVSLIFEDQVGDENVDFIRRVLRAMGKLSVTHIHSLLGRNARKEEIQRIKNALRQAGIAEMIKDNGADWLCLKK